MFTLITDRSRYFKVKRRQSRGEIETALKTPVIGEAFAGRVIEVYEKELTAVSADVGDSYRTIAEKYGADEELLKKINGLRPVFPTCKIFVPKN